MAEILVKARSVLRLVFDSERVSNTSEKNLDVQVTDGFLEL